MYIFLHRLVDFFKFSSPVFLLLYTYIVREIAFWSFLAFTESGLGKQVKNPTSR